MRIVVIGAAGQLGTDLMALLGDEASGIDYPDLDVREPEQVQVLLRERRPDWVINCAAMTNVDGCESAGIDAFAINAVGAQHVAAAAAEVGAAVACISTDFVFGAIKDRQGPYVESDAPGPVSVYGTSKLAGEYLTLQSNPESLILRTCGLYGHAGARGKGGNFVETMLRLAGERDQLRVVADQRLAPTSTVACAQRVVDLLHANARGVFHVTARDHCTWFDFASAIFEEAGVAVDVQAIPTTEYPTPAQRPLMSALTSERLAEVGLEPLPTWRAMLREYLAARGTNRSSATTPAS
jgi:dTDP-4-dehydrorhamnose reductase